MWALRLRNSSAAHLASASWTAGSIRSSIGLRSLTTQLYSVPVFTIGEAGSMSLQHHHELLAMAALRSSSSSTMPRSAKRTNASSTIPTAPSTMSDRAATTALG